MDRLLIAVLVLSAISVSRAEKSLFVHKGHSVHLDVEGYEGIQFYEFAWQWNTIGEPSRVMVKYVYNDTSHKSFKNGTEFDFDEKNFSMLLKNVEERDSGTYTAIIIDDGGVQKLVASYRLMVQEAPPAPQLSLSSAGGSCNVSVNCSARDNWATYTCDHTNCMPVASAASSTGVRIIVMVANGNVRCSTSNGVGEETRSEDICPPKDRSNSLMAGTVASFAAIVFVAVIIFIVYAFDRWRQSGGCSMQERFSTVSTIEGLGTVNCDTSMEETTAEPEHQTKVHTVYDWVRPVADPPNLSPYMPL